MKLSQILPVSLQSDMAIRKTQVVKSLSEINNGLSQGIGLAGKALPLYESSVAAGFPSPADDYVARSLDLHTYLVKHPAATYFARASGDSMQGEGIFSGDILVIDRAIEPQHGHIVIAAVLGEFTCKKLDKHNKKLLAANPDYPSLAITEDTRIEGVVIYSIRQHVCPG